MYYGETSNLKIAVHPSEEKYRWNGLQENNLAEYKTQEKYWKNCVYPSIVLST